METQIKPITPEEIKRHNLEGIFKRINKILASDKPTYNRPIWIDVRSNVFHEYPFESRSIRREIEDRVVSSYSDEGWSINEDNWGMLPPYHKTGRYQFFPGIGRAGRH
jgi:hypothetical protein